MNPSKLTFPTVLLAAFVCFLDTSSAFGERKENLDLPLDAFGEVGEEEEAPDVIYFYGSQYEGDGFFFCLDRSASTRNGELAIEKRETIRAIQQFSARVTFALVFFDRGVTCWPTSGQPASASPGQKSVATSFVQGVQAGSGSCARDGIVRTLLFANRSPTRRNVVIYLGDAGTQCGDDGSHEETLWAVRGANYKKHRINTICVGGDVDDEDLRWCQAMAKQNRGSFKYIPR